MPTNTNTRTDEGFTLAEVLVALSIVLVVGMAALTAFVSVLQSQRSAESTDVAVQVAVDRLEEVRQLDWSRIGFHESTYNTTGQTGYEYTPAYYPCGDPTGCAGEPVVYLDGGMPTNPLHATVTRQGYRVHTYITWVMPAGETVYPVNQEGRRYAPKRIRVVAEGTRGGKAHLEAVETVLAPRVNQMPPPLVPVTTGTSGGAEKTATTEAATCPTSVTVAGYPPVLEWTGVPDGSTSAPVTTYRVLVNGAVRDLVAHDGRSRYSWTAPAYASLTTFEVQGVTSTGVSSPCTPVEWDPATRTG